MQSREIVKNSYSGILKLSLPVVISMLSSNLMSISDTIMVGRLGETELAAVGIGSIVIFTCLSLMWGISGATTTKVSHYFGSKQYLLCDRLVRSATLLAIGFGICFFILAQFTTPFFSIMTPDTEVQKLGAVYAHWRLMGGIFVAYNFLMNGYFQGIGNTRVPMWIAMGTSLLNILLDYLMIFDHGSFGGYGVAGAAIATVISTAVGSAIYITLFFTRIHGNLADMDVPDGFDRRELKDLTKLAIPMSMQNFLGISSFLVMSAIIGWIGSRELAAQQIISQIDQFAFMPIVGLSQAIQVLTGQYLGSENRHGAWVGIKRAYLMGAIFEATIALFCILNREFVPSIFTSDPNIIALSSKIMFLTPLWMIPDALYVVSFNVLRGGGDVKWPMLVGTILHWLKLPFVYLVGIKLGWGLFGVWVVVSIQLALMAIIFFARVRQGKWMQHSLNRIQLPVVDAA